MLTAKWSLEEKSFEGSFSSVVSFGAWIPKIEEESSKAQERENSPSKNPKLHSERRSRLDSYDGESPFCLSYASHVKPFDLESVAICDGGHRVLDSCSSFGVRDSRRSLDMPDGEKDEREDSWWIKVDFSVVDDGVKVETSMLEGKMKYLYLMEKAREEQFLVRNEIMLMNKIRHNTDRDIQRLQHNNDTHSHQQQTTADNGRLSFFRRRRTVSDVSATDFLKPASAFPFVLTGATEPMDVVREEIGGYNMDGHCLQHMLGKGFPSDPPPDAEFGFCISRVNSPTRPSATPKFKRGIHQSLKAKWHPVSRAVSRCWTSDGCSSIDSSIRWRPFGFLRRLMCCTSSVMTSDDE